jgi:hypothetical protein
MGRPTKYSTALAEHICLELMMGKSVRTVCANENMPSPSTVYSWLGEKPDFLEQYTRAKTLAILLMGEEILDIADDSSNDLIKIGNRYVANRGNIKRARLRISVRKLLMGQLQLKKYGSFGSGAPQATPILQAK